MRPTMLCLPLNTTLQSNPHIAMPRVKKDITEHRGDEPTSPVLGKNWQHRQPQIQGVPVGQKSQKQLQRLASQRVNKMLPPRGERSSSGPCLSIKRNQTKAISPFSSYHLQEDGGTISYGRRSCWDIGVSESLWSGGGGRVRVVMVLWCLKQ